MIVILAPRVTLAVSTALSPVIVPLLLTVEFCPAEPVATAARSWLTGDPGTSPARWNRGLALQVSKSPMAITRRTREAVVMPVLLVMIDRMFRGVVGIGLDWIVGYDVFATKFFDYLIGNEAISGYQGRVRFDPRCSTKQLILGKQEQRSETPMRESDHLSISLRCPPSLSRESKTSSRKLFPNTIGLYLVTTPIGDNTVTQQFVTNVSSQAPTASKVPTGSKRASFPRQSECKGQGTQLACQRFGQGSTRKPTTIR